MDQLLPLPVVIPLLTAATVVALNPVLRSRRRVLDGIAIAASAAVTVVLGVITVRSTRGDAIYWFAGFRPSHGIAIGIDFAASPLNAGLGLLAATLVTTAMLFSWR